MTSLPSRTTPRWPRNNHLLPNWSQRVSSDRLCVSGARASRWHTRSKPRLGTASPWCVLVLVVGECPGGKMRAMQLRWSLVRKFRPSPLQCDVASLFNPGSKKLLLGPGMNYTKFPLSKFSHALGACLPVLGSWKQKSTIEPGGQTRTLWCHVDTLSCIPTSCRGKKGPFEQNPHPNLNRESRLWGTSVGARNIDLRLSLQF